MSLESISRSAKANVDRVRRGHAGAGKRHIYAGAAIARQKPGAADIRDKADAGLRHSEARALGREDGDFHAPRRQRRRP